MSNYLSLVESYSPQDQPVPVQNQPVHAQNQPVLQDQPVPAQDQPVPVQDQPVPVQEVSLFQPLSHGHIRIRNRHQGMSAE